MYLGWVSWGGGGGLIIMEDHHGEKPVATAQVPDDPVPRIIAEDHRQDEQVDDRHNRGGEQHDQSDKHLEEKDQ